MWYSWSLSFNGVLKVQKEIPNQCINGEKANYGGFDVDKWTPRTNDEQKKYATII